MPPHLTTTPGTYPPDSSLADPVDRRSAMRVALVLGAGVLFAGCSSESSSHRTASRPTSQPRPHNANRANGASGAGSMTGAGSQPEFHSHKPAWLDDWRSGQASVALPAGIIPRTQWAKRGPNPRLANRMGSIYRITVHHDGMNAFTSTARSAATHRIENIRAAHVGKGWADIGYHFIIDPAGRVWQGRPVSLQGAHVRNNNPGNLGIMVLGNYNDQRVSAASRSALQSTLGRFMSLYRVPQSRVYTHQELVATQCPGRSLQRTMVSLRSGPLA